MKRILLSLVSLMALAIAPLGNAQDTAATVPASFVGTYTTTFDLINSGGPFTAGEEVTFVLRSDNVLCINGLELTDPIHQNGNTVEALWTDSSSNIVYSVSNFSSSFNEVNISGVGFTPFYGQLSGSKTSDSEDCSASTSTPTVTASMTSIFELAESKLSEYFPTGVETQFLDQYVYRYYPATGIYLAFADGAVLLLGGAFGDVVVNAGSISTVLTTLEVYEPVSGGNTGGSTDLWNLTVSGSFDTAFIQNLAFSGITLNGIPAPDLDDLEAINQSIISSLSGVATGVSSVSFTVVENSENRRAFDATFTATVESAGTITYNLRYDYTR